jgi:hypothetical protein
MPWQRLARAAVLVRRATAFEGEVQRSLTACGGRLDFKSCCLSLRPSQLCFQPAKPIFLMQIVDRYRMKTAAGGQVVRHTCRWLVFGYPGTTR